jgi:hypothetical protein
MLDARYETFIHYKEKFAFGLARKRRAVAVRTPYDNDAD